jgi:F-box/leucine-rich repeat protein 2/20
MKRQNTNTMVANPFDLLTEEIVFAILDRLNDDALAKKSFSVVCKAFYTIESRHRRNLRALRCDLILRALKRYRSISHLDLSRCPRLDDATLTHVALATAGRLRSIDLSRSRVFTQVGLASLVGNCAGLVEIDLSNRTELSDSALKAVGEAKSLERLWLARCKMVTDMGIGCVAVGCRKLRLVCLKWCLRVSDWGVGLIAMKCKEIRSLDLSYLPVSYCLVAKKAE